MENVKGRLKTSIVLKALHMSHPSDIGLIQRNLRSKGSSHISLTQYVFNPSYGYYMVRYRIVPILGIKCFCVCRGKNIYPGTSRNLTTSSRGSLMLKALLDKTAKSKDKEGKNVNENEEVISPEIRVGPAEKEKHSVSVYFDSNLRSNRENLH